MKEEEFIKRAYSVDKEAGKKLQQMIKRAKKSPKYAKEISFKNAISHIDLAFGVLIRLFLWRDTPEGVWYWDDLYNKLMQKNL